MLKTLLILSILALSSVAFGQDRNDHKLEVSDLKTLAKEMKGFTLRPSDMSDEEVERFEQEMVDAVESRVKG